MNLRHFVGFCWRPLLCSTKIPTYLLTWSVSVFALLKINSYSIPINRWENRVTCKFVIHSQTVTHIFTMCSTSDRLKHYGWAVLRYYVKQVVFTASQRYMYYLEMPKGHNSRSVHLLCAFPLPWESHESYSPGSPSSAAKFPASKIYGMRKASKPDLVWNLCAMNLHIIQTILPWECWERIS